MPDHEWINAYMFAWSVQTFHCLGLTRYLAMFCRQELGMHYSTFYNQLLNWAFEHRDQTRIGEEYHRTLMVCQRGMSGGHWGTVDLRFGSVVWPTEEMSFLRLVAEHEQVYKELRGFLHALLVKCSYTVVSTVVNDLIEYQQAMLVRPDDGEPRLLETAMNCHAYVNAILRGDPIPFSLRDESLLIKPRRSYASLEEYARLVTWYGRKGGRFTQPDVIYYAKDKE
jgi:hypothetical protein